MTTRASRKQHQKNDSDGLFGAVETTNLQPQQSTGSVDWKSPLLQPSYGSVYSSEERQKQFEQRRKAQERWNKVAENRTVLKTLFVKALTSSTLSSRPAGPAPERSKSFVYSMLSPSSHSMQAKLFRRIISSIILVDLLLFVLSTDMHIYHRFETFFDTTEGVVSTLFLAEYLARLITITEKYKYGQQGPIRGRIDYALTWAALLDLCVTLPFFLELPTGWELPTLTYLRFFRLFRILKTESNVKAVDAVYRVIYYNAEILAVAANLCFLLVLGTACLLYYLRPRDVPNDDFGSILATMYLSTLLLMGQGGPDNAGDLPWYTRAVVLFTSLFSVAMFAIPASMLTWGFESEAQRLAKRARRRALRRQAASADSSQDILEEDSSEADTDEEYFKIIAGEEESSDEETEEDKAYRESFKQGDKDADGTLTVEEYIKLQKTAPPNSMVLNRIQQLERNVADNAAKLDQILSLLQEKAS